MSSHPCADPVISVHDSGHRYDLSGVCDAESSEIVMQGDDEDIISRRAQYWITYKEILQKVEMKNTNAL